MGGASMKVLKVEDEDRGREIEGEGSKCFFFLNKFFRANEIVTREERCRI